MALALALLAWLTSLGLGGRCLGLECWWHGLSLRPAFITTLGVSLTSSLYQKCSVHFTHGGQYLHWFSVRVCVWQTSMWTASRSARTTKHTSVTVSYRQSRVTLPAVNPVSIGQLPLFNSSSSVSRLSLVYLCVLCLSPCGSLLTDLV